MKRVKDKHGKLPYASASVWELKQCLTPYIPFGVTFHPWLDLIEYNFRRGTSKVRERLTTEFGKPKQSKHPFGDSEKWVWSFQVQGGFQVDLETYDANGFRHGNVLLYDCPSDEFQRKVHGLLEGTGHKLSKVEYGADLVPNALRKWSPDDDGHLVVQAIHARNAGAAPELVFLLDLIDRLRWLTYGRQKLDFHGNRDNEFITAYLNDPYNDAVGLKTYIGPGSEKDKSKSDFARIEITADRTAIYRLIKRGTLEEHGAIRPAYFDIRDRLRLREPRYDLIYKNLVRKFNDHLKLHLYIKGFSSKHDLTQFMCNSATGLPLDQGLLIELWQELIGGSPPPYLFNKLFPAPSAPVEN